MAPTTSSITIMRIAVEGAGKKGPTRMAYDLVDRFDRATGTSAMARTTGYTATTAIRMLAAGLFDEPGIVPLERLGREARCVEFLLAGLRERNVVYRETVEAMPQAAS